MDDRVLEGFQKFIESKDDLQKTDMAKMFGTNTPVFEFADFYQRCANDLYKITGAKMFQYLSENDCNSQEFSAYKRAISDILNVFIACWNERETIQRPSSGSEESGSDHDL